MSQYNSFKERGPDRFPEHSNARGHSVKKRGLYRRRSSSSSSSDDSSESPRKAEDLCRELRLALEKNDQKEVGALVKELSRSAKQDLGILRVSIGHTFEFHKSDIEEFFGRFGRIENVIIKESKPREQLDDKKKVESENIAYIIFSQYFSAVVALKVLQSTPEKDRIVSAKLCLLDNSIVEEESIIPGLGQFPDSEFILEVESVK